MLKKSIAKLVSNNFNDRFSKPILSIQFEGKNRSLNRSLISILVTKFAGVCYMVYVINRSLILKLVTDFIRQERRLCSLNRSLNLQLVTDFV